MRNILYSIRLCLKNIRVMSSANIKEQIKHQDSLITELKNQLDTCKAAEADKIAQLKNNYENLNTKLTKYKEDTSNIWNKHIKESDQLVKKICNLEKETSFLLKTAFGRDEWLHRNKDIHKGKRCFLLGTGPSLNNIDLSKIRNELTMGVNGTYLINDLNINYFISVSHVFWKHHIEGLKNFNCDRRFLPPYLNELDSDVPTSWLRVIEHDNYNKLLDSRPWFFSTEPDRYICLGGSVIFAGLQILYHLGFKTVILLGIDHDYGIDPKTLGPKGRIINGKDLHAHFTTDYYNQGGDVHIDIHSSERAYSLANEAFEADGRKILNATPGTKLDIFEKVNYETLF